MPNIKFNYLYRDAANYKKYGFVIFSNPDNIELSEIEALIHSNLIDGKWFYADEWGLPELFLETFDNRIDPTWHEFEGMEYFNEMAKAGEVGKIPRGFQNFSASSPFLYNKPI